MKNTAFLYLARFMGLAAIGVLCPTPALRGAESSVIVPNVVVGNRLETSAVVRLREPNAKEDLRITLRSTAPKRLLLATKPDEAGSESISLRVRQGFSNTPEFWLQALDSSGSATYVAEAPGYESSSGTVTFSPSGIAVVGPFKAEKFLTTTGGEPTTITLYSVRLDSANKFAEEQLAAGGTGLKFTIKSSNPAVGQVENMPGNIAGGNSNVSMLFKASAEGEAVLRVDQPAGLSTPDPYGSLTATVRKPGLSVSTELYVGKDLQVSGVLALGEKAHHGGVAVTLTSADPARLLLATTATEVGTKSITITVPENETAARYYLQALGGTGTVTYTAAAPGFQNRTGIIGLAPSGIVITPLWQGPPDEAQLFRPATDDDSYHFNVKLSQAPSIKLVVWTAQLDPVTRRSADITVQPLRAGVSTIVRLTSRNTAVGKATPVVTIEGGADHCLADFIALGEGTTEITVETPDGFMRSANATTVIGNVLK